MSAFDPKQTHRRARSSPQGFFDKDIEREIMLHVIGIAAIVGGLGITFVGARGLYRARGR